MVKRKIDTLNIKDYELRDLIIRTLDEKGYEVIFTEIIENGFCTNAQIEIYRPINSIK